VIEVEIVVFAHLVDLVIGIFEQLFEMILGKIAMFVVACTLEQTFIDAYGLVELDSSCFYLSK